MIFAPQTSVVRNICGRVPSWIRILPITPPTWSLELQKLEGHTSFVNAVAFSQDGSLLASVSSDLTVRLWNPATGQEVQKFEGHTSSVNAVAFSQDGSLLASASYDQTIRLWNPATGQEVQKLEGHTSSIRVVAFSQDGSLLASASSDRTVRLWNPATGQEVQKLEGHTSPVNAVAFSQDSSSLASVSYDRTVRLWNPATGQEVQKFENMGYIRKLNFTNDDKNLLTDQGTLSIKKKFISIPTPESSSHQTLMIRNNWIQRDNRNFLWLPQEYRDSCSTFYNNTFAFGLHSGQVSILNIDFSFQLSHG